MSAAIVWVEIPVLDLPRALAFYNTLFQLQSEAYDDGERLSAVLWMIHDKPGLSLTQTAGFRPSPDGPWIYLYSEDPLERIAGARRSGRRRNPHAAHLDGRCRLLYRHPRYRRQHDRPLYPARRRITPTPPLR